MFPPDPLVLEGPSPLASLLLPPPPPSYAPRTPAAGGGLRGWGTWPGGPAVFPGLSGQGKCPPRLPDPLVLEGPSPIIRLSSSPLLPPSHVPRTHKAGRGPGKQRTQPGSPAGFPEPDWAVEMLGALRLILQAPEGPSRFPATPQGLQCCPASTSPPASVPPHPTWSLGGSSCLLEC